MHLINLFRVCGKYALKINGVQKQISKLKVNLKAN